MSDEDKEFWEEWGDKIVSSTEVYPMNDRGLPYLRVITLEDIYQAFKLRIKEEG